MDFGLSFELSKDLLPKLEYLTNLSLRIEDHFKLRKYGLAVDTITIGIICVSPEFDFFFKVRNKYSKKNKLIEFDIKIEYQSVKKVSDNEIENIILNSIQEQIFIIDEFDIAGFESEQFKADFNMFCQIKK